MTENANVYTALAAAQGEMGPLLKSAENEAFKRGNKVSRYAELADVVEAVRVPFSKHGLAYFHTIQHVEPFGMCMVTTLVHGPSGTRIDCPVPLIVDRQNMQGMKSATTYAKRVGLESVSGVAPEDDDGNAAAAAAPKPVKKISSAEMKRQLVVFQQELAECQTLVALEKLKAAWIEKMDKDGWPRAGEGDDEEHTFRAAAANYYATRKRQIEEALEVENEPEQEAAE